MQTVFFGPFIGEFGWEMLCWQGWVRKVCKGQFKDWRKIAASTPGREPFYPYVDEFWPLPEAFLSLHASGHAYHTDGWRQGFPGKSVRESVPGGAWEEVPLVSPPLEAIAEAMLKGYCKLLPEDTLFFVPWKPNYYKPDRLSFGFFLKPGEIPYSAYNCTRALGYEQQLHEYLTPSPAGQKGFREIFPADRPLIAVYPRCREIRRSDKNWPREHYEQLIQRIQATWPDLPVAILGDPCGAYFAEGVPRGCIDLINVSEKHRFDIQVAALKQCQFALGSMSGGVTIPLAVGCPTLIWGFANMENGYRQANFMNTAMHYIQEMSPTVECIIQNIITFAKQI